MPMEYFSNQDSHCGNFEELVENMFNHLFEHFKTTKADVYRKLEIPRTTFQRMIKSPQTMIDEDMLWDMIGIFKPNPELEDDVWDCWLCLLEDEENRVIREASKRKKKIEGTRNKVEKERKLRDRDR